MISTAAIQQAIPLTESSQYICLFSMIPTLHPDHLLCGGKLHDLVIVIFIVAFG